MENNPSIDRAPFSEEDSPHVQIARMCHELERMRQLGAEVPKRYGMNEHEFEAFMNNPVNFSHEDWQLICQARAQVQGFLKQAKELLGQSLVSHPKKKVKKKTVPRQWINVK